MAKRAYCIVMQRQQIFLKSSIKRKGLQGLHYILIPLGAWLGKYCRRQSWNIEIDQLQQWHGVIKTQTAYLPDCCSFKEAESLDHKTFI